MNGTQKTYEYFNKYQNKNILLESSWELEIAKYLDLNDITWFRPKFIKWIDKNLKTRRYFPDFYIPKYNIFLDPKNKYVINLDQEKLEKVSEMVSVIYGNPKDIIKYLEKLIGGSSNG